jgi:hypothetical protein
LKSVSGFQRLRITINSLTLDVIHILFCRSSLICCFFFLLLCYGILTLSWMLLFLVIWACPLVFEFLELLSFFTFSRLFLFSHWNFLLPPSVRCDPSRDFFHERKIIQAQKQGMYLFQNVKGIIKIAFSHFKRKQLWSINFDLVKCDGLIFAKMHFNGSWATSSLHTIIYTFKNTWFKSYGVRVIHFFFFFLLFYFIFVYNLVTSMIELLDSLVILQIEC